MPDFDAIRDEFDLPTDFPAEVQAEAERIAAMPIVPRKREVPPGQRRDLTDVPLVTIDPPGSMDLDQAVHVEQRRDGWRVQYAIADVGAVVGLASPIDAEARRRGQTIYLPDARIPLHPQVLSEGALSLLPGETRRAAVWTIDVDGDGTLGQARVERAIVRSVERFDYEGLQADLDAASAHESVAALPDLGLARRAQRIAAGAIELGIPEQEIRNAGSGWELIWRKQPPVEGANAEVSLLTGMCAARMMLDAKVGILRTLPSPDEHDVIEFLDRARARGLHERTPAETIEALHGSNLGHLALMYDATALLRGAGYTAFDGSAPEDPAHHGVGGIYAHVTAPLRRLVDRFATEVCLALAAGERVPDDLRAALPELPTVMETSDQKAGRVTRAAIDQVEAWMVEPGQPFRGVCVRDDGDDATVVLQRPAVIAECASEGVGAGQVVHVEVAGITGREVRFRSVGQ